jgi:RNA polymerase sigma factor (sigma-70 family)
MPYLDIVQEGNMGLLKAINRYDMRRGYHLSTYATQWIRQHITRGIADKSRAIRLPVYKNSQFGKVQYALSTRANELNRDLTRLEIEETAGMTIAEYEELRQQAAPEIQSLNVLIGDDGSDMELQDILVDENSRFERETTSMVANDELSNIFADSGLNDREKFILGLRYGVQPEIVGPLLIMEGGTPLAYADCVSNHGMTLEDIGQVFGVTRERVRQLETQAMQTLKRRYRGEQLA